MVAGMRPQIARQHTTAPPFALLVTSTAFAVSPFTLVPPVLPDIIVEFGVPDSFAGLVIAATSVPGIVFAPALGLLSDRYGRRRLLLACLLLVGIGGIVSACAPGFAALVAARFVQGIGGAGLIGLVIATIGDGWDGQDRVRRLGANAAALTLSVVAFPLIGGTLAGVGGWRIPLAVQGSTIVLALVLALLWTPAQVPTSCGGLASLAQAFHSTLRDRPLRADMLRGAAAYALLFGAIITVLPTWLADVGLGPEQRGLLLALPGAPSALVAIVLAPLTRRFGARRLIRAAFAVWTLGFVIAAASPSIPGLTIALVAYGIGEGLALPTLQNAVMRHGSPSTRGSVAALYVAATRAGQSAGPLLAAEVSTAGIDACFMAAAILAALLALTTSCRHSRDDVPDAALRLVGSQDAK
jgi:MFS family permease